MQTSTFLAALALLLTLLAAPRIDAASCGEDSAECSSFQLPASCGKVLLGQAVADLCPVACDSAACKGKVKRAPAQATISTIEGDVKLHAAEGKQVFVVKDDGDEVNLTDALTATAAEPQFKAQERRSETTEGQIKGLLDTLQTVRPL